MPLSSDEARRFADLLKEHAESLTARWAELAGAGLRGRLSGAELRRQVEDLRKGFAEALSAGSVDLTDERSAELRAQLGELSSHRARQGFTATETAVSIYAFKDAVLEVLGDGTDAGTLRDYVAFSTFVDRAALFTFDSYVKVREGLIADQAEQLLELSTPVVKLWEGVVAVPLVGTLDSARAQVVMERLLQTLVDTSSPYAIIDITGVPAVDTQVAQHILKTVVAARLMGADCIISGIRPQIAQTIVALGIEFGDIATKASLADALRYVLGKTGSRSLPAKRAER
ncbi:putative anti-anti-sigma regulatory factor [Actinoplanes missouriensis 431]|uniref:Putative anti-anti-sigma regulatory factor n=1 Tax=Actinoplanes missouriensis (strain ATCC 14538 / DSM 43046 / CBS 188.64 / JCM 3121 / NBRC 102363 / NCIMB 12654 / NRRL B-3342 / UNCC 431) TaxID=512565 RepID=I0GXA0_ACTM4|nr:STAS domain-containing protein [Actinoplanes missouriensis]BAL85387.1 putative anti-anti-sigma regulatory factor [Actinoplanes missouriensis 431]